jgi:AcrR family transcriptional regulator
MELFGQQGYHATTVAQIEAAAGLSAGAGGLYRHFRTKRGVLEEALRRQADEGRPLLAYLDGAIAGTRRERFLAVARAGLRRLAEERDINRLLLRDLATFPDLLELVREQELRRVHAAITEWLRQESPAKGGGERDHAALAAVFMSAVSHYWTLADVFGGEHPFVTEERFLAALADLATGTSR